MIISILYILLVTLGIGLPLVLLILPKQNTFSTLGLSFPLGIGIFTLLMFVSNLLGFRFNLLNESLILLIFSIPVILLRRNELKELFGNRLRSLKNSKISLVEKVMLGVLIFLVVTSLVNTLYWPVHIWDSLVLYDFRGHVFAQTGFMKDAFINDYYTNYPLLTSLAHTIIYIAGGRYPQFLYSLYYLSLGLTFYGFLREFVSRKIGLFATLILLIAQPLFYHSMLSLTNLPFSVYLSLGAICVFLWNKKREVGYLILTALLVGLSTWTRSNEPFWAAILLIVFIVSIYHKKIWETVLFSLFFFPIREAWKVFQSSLNGTNILTTGEIAGYSRTFPLIFNLERWPQVIGYLYINVFRPWGAVFVAFIVATIALFLLRKQREYFLIFFITFIFLVVLIAGTLQLSISTDYWYRIGDAAERLSMLFYPLFVYCVALVVQDIVKRKQ